MRSCPVLFAPILALFCAASLAAADYRPTLYDDPAPDGCSAEHCSLREAVIAANASPGLDRILLSAGVYPIETGGADEDDGASGDLDVTDDLELLGPSAAMTTIEGNVSDRVLHVFGAGVDVTLRGLVVEGGNSVESGSAILIESAGSGLIEECLVKGNGSIVGEDIGVIEIRGAGLTAAIRRSALIDNNGIGLLVAEANAVVENSTIGFNGHYELAADVGGAIACTHCTIVGDVGPATIDVAVGATLDLANTLVVGDCAPDGPGLIDDLGGSLESPGTTCGIANDGVATALIGPSTPGDHGGSTPAIVTLADSPSVDVADDSLCLATDQRGAARPKVDCDVGAVELESSRPPTPVLADGFEQGNLGSWIVVGN